MKRSPGQTTSYRPTTIKARRGPESEAWKRVDHVALTLARIIGRRMARENFEARVAANDNRPIVSEETEDEADKE